MKKIILLLFAGISFFSYAQKNYWTSFKGNYQNVIFPQERVPDNYTTYTLAEQGLKQELTQAPDLYSGQEGIRIVLPSTDGNFSVYKVYKSSTLSAGLQQKFPGIQTYRAFGLKKPSQASIVISPWGVNIEIFKPGKSAEIIQAINPQNKIYWVYKKTDLAAEPFECFTQDHTNFNEQLQNSRQSTDGVLRTYRYAVGTTGEYSQYHVNLAIQAGVIPSNATDAQKKAVVLAAVTTTVDRLNTIYERDLGIHLALVSNEDQVIFLDPNTDPYDNSDIISMLNNNTNVLNQYIGVNNYDGGHLFSTYPGGGISGLGVICSSSQKARSVTGSANPIGDPYDVDYVAHEVGHSFGANHTFANSCQSNRNMGTSVEPGSGSTIMAYAGVCSPNVQNHSDDYFHVVSISEITDFITNYATCAQQSNIGNTAPQVNTVTYTNNYVPKSTPFILEANATDTQNDFLTYCWEEVDVINDSNINAYTPVSTNTAGPMFRSYLPTEKNYRSFPPIGNILDNSYGSTWEVLPSVSRNMNFVVTVRDNHPGGGQTPAQIVGLQVDGSTGPFRVTSQGADEVWQVGQTKTITWDVAGTTGGQVNCGTVDILFSDNNGISFDYVLASDVPNDGSETITVPSGIDSPNGRIMIKGHNRYFFDLAKGKISIGTFQNVCNTTTDSNTNVNIPDNNPSGTSTTINVSDNNIINDVNINLNIAHTYIQDLIIKVISPSGTEVVLYNQNCGSQDNIIATFDDDGNNLNCSSIQGHIKPVGNLSDFYGENANGTWTLWVSDNAAQDVGTIVSWGVEICHIVTSGIENNNLQALNIWPNPALNNVQISFKKDNQLPVEIRLLDISGREVIRKKITSNGTDFNTNLNVSSFKKGLYLIEIKNGSHQSIKKLLIN